MHTLQRFLNEIYTLLSTAFADAGGSEISGLHKLWSLCCPCRDLLLACRPAKVVDNEFLSAMIKGKALIPLSKRVNTLSPKFSSVKIINPKLIALLNLAELEEQAIKLGLGKFTNEQIVASLKHIKK